MKRLFLVVLLFFPLSSEAADYAVFGVKTNFPMVDGEPILRDLYLNIGTNQGIKEGSQLEAHRLLTTIDEINQRTGNNITFKIARLRVIHAESDMAIARVVKMLPPESTPTGTYTNVMVGDRISVASK